ncbi:Asp23/Gls24 family envelope stress response protein [Paenibacillus sp. NPDC057886]|uniref:Asp23/Gls24 family envelope stress response protein n=1 Tax=Paenibacillus sp. NPDC057886 TaxID=3346270 RepID=UPI00368A5267
MLIQSIWGTTTFSKAVLTKIVGKTISMTEGIGSVSTGMIETLAQKLTGSSIYSGIEIHEEDSIVNVHLNILVKHGIRIHEVCRHLQENVKETLEKLTGIGIGAVHIKVEGISFS